MDASAIMTRNVVTVGPETPIPEVVKVLLENQISAVPVLDDGTLVGIVSEGDLLRRAEIGTERRRSRWMELGVSNPSLAAEFLKQHGRKAKDVMTQEVITIGPTTPVVEIANVLELRHVKRVPVVSNGKLVGIVSRANIIRALASGAKDSQPATTARDSEIQEALSRELLKQRWAVSPAHANVVVRDGVVHLWGFIDSEEARRAVIVTAENIPGVRGVEDHMEYPPIYPFF